MTLVARILVSANEKTRSPGAAPPHELVKWIRAAVRIALRQPEVTACSFLSVCLVLIDPPVAHGLQGNSWSQRRPDIRLLKQSKSGVHFIGV